MDMAPCTEDAEVGRQIKQHAIDEARHSGGYVTLWGLIFPEAAEGELLTRLRGMSPGYTENCALAPTAGSPYSYPAAVDEQIQMNIAEIRTPIYHLPQRPVLLGNYCETNQRPRVRQILDWLLVDEMRHIAYTACLIERVAQASGSEPVMDLMRERVKDFNEITEEELARNTLAAA